MGDFAFKPLRLADAANVIGSADLLLWRDVPGATADGIRFVGRGRYSHAGKASWRTDEWGGRSLWCLESRELKGCRAVTLASQVKRFPGQIDVFRANAIGLLECTHHEAKVRSIIAGSYYDRRAADELASELTGQAYGYLAILRTAAIHSPLLWIARLLSRYLPRLLPVAKLLGRLEPEVTDDALDSGKARYCSVYCAMVDRVGGGFDPVPDLADAYTEPSDLARSIFYRGRMNDGYLGTLVE